jgi:hypothetical protein
VLASAVVLGAAIVSVKVVGLNSVARAYLDLDKPELGSARLLHFLGLAYLISAATVARPWAERMGRIVGGTLGRSLQGMGRNSLLFFAFGSLSSAGGRSLMVAATALGTPRLFVQFMGLATRPRPLLECLRWFIESIELESLSLRLSRSVG